MRTTLTIEQSAELIKRGVSADKASMVCLDFNGTYAYVSGEEVQTVRDCVNGQFYVEESRVFALADLLSLLPKEITITMDFYNVSRLACLHISATNERWYVSYKYEFEEREYWCKMFNSENLIDALCKLLLWAIDHNHVKLD